MRFKPIYDRQELAEHQNDYAVVIPVINEGKRIHALLERMSALNIQRCFDVIIVDGGSTDGSLDLAHLTNYRVNTLLTRVSPGALGTQLQCAYDFVLERGYNGVITIDGNNKDDPEAIPRFRDKLESGFDFVQGSRFIKGGGHRNTPPSRLLAVRLIHAPVISLASGIWWTDTTQGFRGHSREYLLFLQKKTFAEYFSDYSFLFISSILVRKSGFRSCELGTTRDYPAVGRIPTRIRGIRAMLIVLGQLGKAVSASWKISK